MINPNKHIRGAWITAIKAATGLDAWDKRVPKSIIPVPKQYLLVSGQTKSRFAVAKECYEWMTTITVEIINIQEQGYASTAVTDDIEENVLNAVATGIPVPGFTVKMTRLVEQRDMDVETDTESIGRRILMYEQWLNRA